MLPDLSLIRPYRTARLHRLRHYYFRCDLLGTNGAQPASLVLEDPAVIMPSACPLPQAQQESLFRFDREILELRPALQAFARRLLRQDTDVDDLVQETIVKALSARDRFQDGTNLKAWLFTIMRNSFNTRWRRSRRETTPGSEVIEISAITPSTQAMDLWARETMERMLNDLTPAHREILILIPVLGLGYEDAAEICNCSVGTIKSRLNRARMALAALVDEDRA